jgi:deoxyribose-phosphate aldolase
MTIQERSQEQAEALKLPLRNPGTALELGWLRGLRVNRSAVERRAATLGTRRSVKKNHQAAWLLKAVSCIDLTVS